MARAGTGPAGARFADLRQRVISAVPLAGGAFLLLWLGGIWSAALTALLIGAMAWEWRAMVAPGPGRDPGRDPAKDPASGPAFGQVLGVVAAAGAVAAAHFGGMAWGAAWLGAGLGLGLIIDFARRERRQALWSVAGLAPIGVAGLAFLWLRAFEPYGFLTAFWIILVVAAADMGGYFAGRLIGGPKLWPKVSPKKTWAGLGGGVALAFVLGGLFSWATTGTYFHEVCTVSAVAALLAQLGDLAESAAKRRFAVKDSGTLIPGHGGALDRFDGLMAATLVAALVTHWRGQTVFIW